MGEAPDSIAYFAGFLFGLAVAGLIWLFVGAALLMAAVRLVEGFWPALGRSLLVVLLAAVAAMIASFVVGFVLGIIGGLFGIVGAGGQLGLQLVFGLGLLLLAFAIYTALVSWMIKRPDGSALALARAAMVAAMQIGFALLLSLGGVAVVFLLSGATVYDRLF